jgi:hypothetical protein
MVNIVVSAPEMLPPFERGVLFLRHWKLTLAPEAATEKLALPPGQTA